ncbi:MAG: phosphomevalonate kinase [Sporolactobacillus sp.]
MPILARAPGKIYIAGEYAVIEPGYPAIIAAVDQFVTVKVEKRESGGRIQSANAQTFPLNWTRKGNQLIIDDRDNPFQFILSAVERTEQYIKAMGKPLAYYQLTVSSDLDRKDGKKYGLGSSAAVTVATVNALLAYYGIQADRQTVFKLAALAHLSVQGNGSCGDIAASVYGGWIAYSSFDRQWLSQAIHSGREWLDLLARDWPGLSVRPLTLPPSLRLFVGWTGIPASTYRLVDKVEQAKHGQREAYQRFLARSKACVNQMIAGFQTEHAAAIQSGIRQYRQILRQLSELCGLSIETEKLQQLCDIAERYGGSAKSSGAGGGDCGILLADRAARTEQIRKEWDKQGILLLGIHVYDGK